MTMKTSQPHSMTHKMHKVLTCKRKDLALNVIIKHHVSYIPHSTCSLMSMDMKPTTLLEMMIG